jgi:hypothetical protein
MFKEIDRLFKVFTENLARSVDRKQFIKTVIGGAFGSMLLLLGDPSRAAAGITGCPSWCETSYGGDCAPPNGNYCSGCSTSTKCPSGYKVSYTWGYSTSGCWCSGDYTCCDCTPSWASGAPSSADCGCKTVKTFVC